ncbi:hypothetical protein BGX34_009845 [Mortierella sp. NVP85]|nr:hypothetical protein BGX34_009845 [Mortierella sp. NVP85]
MKPTLAVASLALIATVSAQGPVDPAKLPKGWCMFYTESVCAEEIVPASCGANSSYSSSCISTFSNDKVCTSFNVSCVCTPTSGGQQKDVSMDALNRTFGLMHNLCENLVAVANSSGPGLVSNGYKPDGKRPNTTASASPPASTNGNSAASIQTALSTVALAVISFGLSMISM